MSCPTGPEPGAYEVQTPPTAAVTPWTARPALHDAVLLLVTYALLAYASIQVARQPGTIATIWLANGAAIALIVSAPRERRFLLLAMAACGNLLANLAVGDGWLESLAFVVPNAMEVTFGVWCLRRAGLAAEFAVDLRSFLMTLLAGALLPPLVGASVGATVLQTLGLAQWDRVWVDWYIGAALGAVVMLPLLLSLRTQASQTLSWPTVGTVLAVLGTTLTCAAAFHFWRYPFVVVGMGLSVVAVLRPRIVALSCALAVVATVAVSLAWGWFVPLNDGSIWEHAEIYLSLMIVVVPAQLLAVLVARQRAIDEMLSAVGSREDEIVILADMQGVYRWVNRTRELYHGTPNSQVLGRKSGDIAQGRSDAQALQAAFERALAGGVVHAVTSVHYARKGERTMDVRIQPAYDEEGRQIGVLFNATDITEPEKQRQALEETTHRLQTSNANLEQFVRIASHDLREPLNTIQQFATLIEQDQAHKLDASGQLWLAQVREGATRMRRLLDDVMQFVRLDEAPVQPAQAISLDEALQEVLAALSARMAASGASVSSVPLGSVQGHAALLKLLLQNLVANAIKFMPPGRVPSIAVSIERSPGQARLTVTDNGIGIAAHQVAELGQPFKRLHARRKYEGTGLGLAICKRVAEQHGGALHIESVPGEGSRFTLAWPQTESAMRG